MHCPFCSAMDSRVIDSRPTVDGSSIRRRRECTACGKRFTTYEKIETVPIFVIKKDGTRELFEAEKIKRALVRAVANRPVSMADIDRVAQDVEATLQNELEQEVSSKKIGEMVMSRLRKLDDVSYVRFASVYRQFEDIDTFRRQLEELLAENHAQ